MDPTCSLVRFESGIAKQGSIFPISIRLPSLGVWPGHAQKKGETLKSLSQAGLGAHIEQVVGAVDFAR